ncbi:MAG: flagellar motor switch protein FliN [Balneolaceae bacterium]|nr:flagellar motor switch protein FliN [Balneolaceae bacterium]
MEQYKDQITRYLPKIEEFLTSVILEETTVTLTETGMIDTDSGYQGLGSEDIYLFAHDAVSEQDIIAILDKEWFGLLSSIMLGIDEKTFNEKTIDLLKKFSEELQNTFKSVLNDDGIEFDLGEIQPVAHAAMYEQLHHTEYLHVKLEVEGLADENVHAGILIGNPDARIEIEEVVEEDDVPADGFKEMSNGESILDQEEEISGSYIEFEDFDDDAPLDIIGEDGKSMDMLRDVEMEVSVELGRIELPLGRVLQLAKGSVIELDKLAGEPVDIMVNGQKIAQGEVVVIDEHFGVRISNLITTRQHLVKMN